MHYKDYVINDKFLSKASKACGYGILILILKQRVENKNLLQSFNSFNFNDTHKEKLCFTQFSKKIYWKISLAASDLFRMFTQSVKFYTFHCHSVKTTDVW